jgi:hypothetical protein
VDFFTFADVVELQSSKATQCILTREQEDCRQRGTAALDNGATTDRGGMIELATASVCGSAAAGHG